MWFILDGCGIICCIVTYAIIFTVSGLTTKISILQLESEDYWNSYVCISIYAILLGLGSWAHLTCVLTDPGSVPKNTVLSLTDGIRNKNSNICQRCKCLKAERVHHCSTCGRCIQRMDHHCPWVNNCVGFFNQKHFLACIYSIILLIVRAAFCPMNPDSELCQRTRKEASLDMFLGILAFFLAVIFCLFCGVMMYDQLHCISNNTSGIDQLKKTVIEKVLYNQRPVKTNFEEAFGGPFSVFWFLATPVKPAPGLLSETEMQLSTQRFKIKHGSLRAQKGIGLTPERLNFYIQIVIILSLIQFQINYAQVDKKWN